MNIVYLSMALCLLLIIIIIGILDAHHMHKIHDKYDNNNAAYLAYKKGALMGMIKAIILSIIFYSIIHTISIYNNTLYTHIKFKTNNIINRELIINDDIDNNIIDSLNLINYTNDTTNNLK